MRLGSSKLPLLHRKLPSFQQMMWLAEKLALIESRLMLHSQVLQLHAQADSRHTCRYWRLQMTAVTGASLAGRFRLCEVRPAARQTAPALLPRLRSALPIVAVAASTVCHSTVYDVCAGGCFDGPAPAHQKRWGLLLMSHFAGDHIQHSGPTPMNQAERRKCHSALLLRLKG